MPPISCALCLAVASAPRRRRDPAWLPEASARHIHSAYLTWRPARGIDAPNEPERGGVRLNRSPGPLSAPSTDSRITILRHLGETLAIALAGGATLGLAGVPAGWLSGSILAVAGHHWPAGRCWFQH